VEITRTDDGDLLLLHLDLFLVELLRQIPLNADPGDSDAARERLFSVPTSSDPKANDDWKNYVHPGMRQLFETATETVKRDLETFEQMDEQQLDEPSARAHCTLRIPAGHFENWLNALNQARLALAARHAFTDSDLDTDEPLSLIDQRGLSLFQIHFYGFLQECLIRELR